MQSYGGFWVRVLAYLIDFMILQFATSMLMLLGVGGIFALGNAGDAIVGGGLIVTYLLALVLNWLYFALLESSAWQGTLGKQALKLVVADENGRRIGFGRATGRYFAKFISSLVVLFGFFMVGWTQRKQGLHDMIAGTVVYRADAPELVANAAKVFE